MNDMGENRNIPRIRFQNHTVAWEQRKLGDLYERFNVKNDLTYGTDKVISVANMYFKDDVRVSDLDYLKTYNVFKVGDIAFEGNRSKRFAHGRFVENTIGDGIVSHVFVVFRPLVKMDLWFWKYAINNEDVMGPVLTRATKSSTMMTDLVVSDFLNETIRIPSLSEQNKIGQLFVQLDDLIALHQRKLEKLKQLKQALLQQMFV
jgi:type I restriction enzyme S subunit